MVLSSLKYTCTHVCCTLSSDSHSAFGIRNYHIRSLVVCSIASGVVGASYVVVLDWSFDLDLYSVESPCWVLAPCQNFVQIFFLQELRAGTNSSGPVV